MRTFVYSYQDSQGLKHEAEIAASDKDAAYRVLRERGIRPIRVSERIVPVVRKGFRGLRKRDAACIVVFVLCLVIGVWYLAMRSARDQSNDRTFEQSNIRATSSEAVSLATPRPRRQIEGLPDNPIPTATNAFRYSSERFLALHAQPGLVFESAGFSLADLPEALEKGIVIHESDADAVQDLKRVVAWLKEEAATLLRSGKGLDDIGFWFAERQKMEAGFREQIAEKVAKGRLSKDEANATLSGMSLKAIP